MAVMPVQTPALTGTAPTFAAVTANDLMPNDGKTYLDVKNGGGASINVTIASQQNCNQGVNHPIVVAVPAAGERLIGPFDITRFADPTTGQVAINYSAIATVTAAAIRLP